MPTPGPSTAGAAARDVGGGIRGHGSQFRAFRKWTFLLFAIAVVLLVLSSLVSVTFATPRYEAGIGHGGLYVERPPSNALPLFRGWRMSLEPNFEPELLLPTVDLSWYAIDAGISWVPPRNDGNDDWSLFIWVPLWSFAGALLPPAALLFWWGRRPRPGMCRCGYDLTGNVSGICPECGLRVSEAGITVVGGRCPNRT